jgi:hypothetical protein
MVPRDRRRLSGRARPLTVTEEANGDPLIRELFLLAPKKSSKTSYGAAMMLTALLMNKRPRAEFLLIAPTQSVADLAFSQAVGMIELDPELRYFEAEDTRAPPGCMCSSICAASPAGTKGITAGN